jgi:hypothetical protein
MLSIEIDRMFRGREAKFARARCGMRFRRLEFERVPENHHSSVVLDRKFA